MSNCGGVELSAKEEDESPVMVIAGFSVEEVEGETKDAAAPLSTTSV